jgi:hypothetical protein
MNAGVSDVHVSPEWSFHSKQRHSRRRRITCILNGVTARSCFVALSVLIKFYWQRCANRSTDFNVILSFSHGDNEYLLETTQIGGIARPTVAPIIYSFQAFSLILFPLLNKNHNLVYSQLKATVPRFAYYRRLDDQAFDLRKRLFGLFGQIYFPIPVTCEYDDEDQVPPYRLYVVPSCQLSADSERPPFSR